MRLTAIERRSVMEVTAAGLLEARVRDPAAATRSHLVETLYRERGRELWAFARRLGLSAEECDDAVQEAHLRLWRAIHTGRRPTDPVAWIYRVLYRLAMDRHRGVDRLRGLIRRWPTATIEAPDDAALELGVWAAVDDLPPRQRAAVYLHYRADLGFDRVARVMGITPGAARTASSRGLETIRRRLVDGPEDER
jgi:RNA polymerase sigma-70 factor (ECF subfamily)